MLAVIDDSEEDYFLYKVHLISGVPHVHFRSLQEFISSPIKFCCILTDLNLPDSWGIETITKIRQHTDSPILVSTGAAGIYLTGRHFIEMAEAGAMDVFEKHKFSNKEYCNMIRKEILTCLSKTKP